MPITSPIALIIRRDRAEILSSPRGSPWRSPFVKREGRRRGGGRERERERERRERKREREAEREKEERAASRGEF